MLKDLLNIIKKNYDHKLPWNLKAQGQKPLKN